MKLLAGVHYDPAAAVTKATTALLAMTAFDTTNLRLASITVPSHGMLRWRIVCVVHGATTLPSVLLGVLEGASVRGRLAPMVGGGNLIATGRYQLEATGLITGLTPAGSVTLDAAYGVEVVVASTGIKYGGPNNTTTNDAFGGIVFEVFDPAPAAGAGSGATAQEVWEYATRVLTAGTNIALAKGTGVTGFNDIAAADVWAVGTRALTDKAGFSLTQTFPTNFSSMSITAGGAVALAATPPTAAQIRSEIDANSAKLDVAVSTRLAGASYTAPDNAGIATAASEAAAAAVDAAAIKAKTDSLTFTVANKLDVNLLVINGVTVIGTGTEIDKWRATGT